MRHAEDDDYIQGHHLIRDVMDDAQRERYVASVVGHLLDSVQAPVLTHAFELLGRLDTETGKRIGAAYHAQVASVAGTTGQGPVPSSHWPTPGATTTQTRRTAAARLLLPANSSPCSIPLRVPRRRFPAPPEGRRVGPRRSSAP